MKKTPELLDSIVGLIKEGVSYAQAAQAVGVGRSTLMRWKKEDQDFRDTLKKAEAQSHVSMVSVITKAAKDDWKAAAWWLERRYPQRYARRTHEPKQEDGMGVGMIIRVPQYRTHEANTPAQPGTWAEDDREFFIEEMQARGVPTALIEMVRSMDTWKPKQLSHQAAQGGFQSLP